MTKKWSEVASSEGFKALPPDAQDSARRQYFDQVVAPQVPEEHVDKAWSQFSTDAGVGRRELPSGVSASSGHRSAQDPRRLDAVQPVQPEAASVQDQPELSDVAKANAVNAQVASEFKRLKAINPGVSDDRIAALAGERYKNSVEQVPTAPQKSRAELYSDKGYTPENAQANATFDAGVQDRLNQRAQTVAPDERGDRVSIPYDPNVDATKTAADAKSTDLAQEAVQIRQNAQSVGPVIAGLAKGYGQAQGFGQAVIGFAGDAFGNEDVKKWGIDAYNDTMRKVGNMAVAKDFTDISSPDDAATYLAETLSYGAFQAAQAIATGGLGGAAGKMVGQKVIGEVVGLAVGNVAQELGSIYGDAQEEAARTGKPAPSLWHVAAMATAASVIDTFADRAGWNAVTVQGQKRSVLKRIGDALEQPLIQGSTEMAQKVPEEIGAGKDPFRDGTLKDYINEGAAGAVMGGGPGVVSALRPDAKPVEPNRDPAGLAKSKGFLVREEQIKSLRDAGEDAAADLLQKKHDKQTTIENVDGEIARLPGNADFAAQYRDLRINGLKPAEAAARSAVTVTYKGLAQASGVPDKAMAAALEQAKTMPLDKVPGFLHKFTEGLAKRGMIQPNEATATVGPSLEAARDDAMESAISTVYQPVKPMMDAVQALESEQFKPGPGGVSEPVSATLQDKTGAPFEVTRAFRGRYDFTVDGKEAGSILYTDMPSGGFKVTGVDVKPEFQRRGIATSVYDFLESQVTKEPFKNAGARSEAGEAFRADRSGNNQPQAPAEPAQAATETVATPAQEIDLAAHDAATSPLNSLPEPTQAQKEAGNYKVGRVNLHGLNISIENPEGSVRKGTSPDGSKWENTLAAHYGYIRGTEGNDGDHVDTFIGPNPESRKVFVVDQVNKDGSFDEHKVMLGMDSLQQADDLYHANYHEGWTGRGAITEMPMDQFKEWVKDGTKTQPVGQIATPDSGAKESGGASEVQSTGGAGPAASADKVVYLGRNNVPLTEGGKAFKTRKAADDARKLNTMMRVVRADGGYALTEKTPAQIAAQEKAAKRLRTPQTSAKGEPIPAHAFIASEGGLSGDNRSDMGMQGNIQIGNRKLFAGEGKGLSIERATERLIEAGYLPEGAGHDQARDLIKRSLTKPQYNADGYERLAELDSMERFNSAQESYDDAVAEVEALSDNQFDALLDADIPWESPSNTSTEAAMKALGFTDQEIQDATANQPGEPQDGSESRGVADEGVTSQAQADPGRREETPAEPEEVSRGVNSDREVSGRGGTSKQGTSPAPDRANAGSDRQDASRATRGDDSGGKNANGAGVEEDQKKDGALPNLTPAPAGVSVSAFDATMRTDGTLAVKGDATAIREALKDIPAKSMTAMKGGILVGKTQAERAQEILNNSRPSAREVAQAAELARQEEKKAKARAARAEAHQAPEGLSVGITPSNAEPVTVKNGVVYVGKYPAQNFETGEDVTVADGASAQQIAEALKSAGALAQKQRFFGLAKEDVLTAPTKEEVVARQDQADQAAKDKAAADRTADKQAREDEDRKRIAKASEAAADTFELGGDAMANLTGQQDIFGGVAEQELEPVRQSIESMRRKLVEIEDRIVGAAGMAQGFIEDAMKSRKVPAELKQQRNELREQMREERKRLDAAQREGNNSDGQVAETKATLDSSGEIAHNGTRIYKVNVKFGDKAEARWAVESANNKTRRESGDRNRGGDSLHETLDAAKADADRQSKSDAQQLESDQAIAKERKAASDAENARKSDDYSGFLNEFTENRKELIRKALGKELNFSDGGVMTIRARIDGLMAKGILRPSTDEVAAIQPMSRAAFNRASNKEQEQHEKRMREAGTKTEYLVNESLLGKTAYDYAQHLLAHTPKAATKIEDAGQKIGGARKDRWKDRGLDLTDLDGMSESEGAELATKANVWKPDYEAMAAATEPVTAAMVKTVYDQLAAQPKKNTPEGRRNYVTMMQAVRKAYSEAKSPEDVKQAGDKVKRAIGLYTDNAEAKKLAREVLFSVYKGRSDPFVLGYNELSKAKKMVEDGFPAKGEPWKKRLSLRAYTASGFTPRGIEVTLKESAELGTPLTNEQIAAGFYRINNKDGKAVGYAPTKADAEAAAKTIYERDLKKGPSDKEEPHRPNLDKLKRENLPSRIDRDATAEDFVKDFGFRGVEFGNWAAQDERQRIINMAYDGLKDLAEIMGIPPKALSLNGTMGMAFGARGGGKFAAHYEPGKLVINMTKINGGGSMAHEWAHALDHYFGELNQKDAYTTKARGASGWYDEQQYKGVPITRMEKDAQGKWANVSKMRLANLRPEMAKAFDGVMSALFSGQETKAQMVRSEELSIERYQALENKETDPDTKAMYKRGIESRKQALEELRKDPEDKTYPKGRSAYAGQAQALSGKSSNGYWTRPTEMFARAFESWVFDKVTAMGARSDYLVHGVEEDRFAGGEYKGNPYPTGAERATINAAFDKLASTIQTKETDKGVAMFARGAPQTEAFKKWFGESKVVDADGKPMVMYHGTNKSERGDAFTQFDTYASNYGLMGMGGYFTANPEVASSYTSKGRGDAPSVYPAYLSIKNPIDMDAEADVDAWENQFEGIADYHEGGDTNEDWYRAAEAMITDQEVPMYEGAEIMQEGLRVMGYDGITHMGGGRVKADGVKHRVYIAFDPEQIKSATGNNGQFDPANPDIRYALGADAFRLGITPRKFMPVADVQKAVDQLSAKWKDGPKIKVVLTPDELPLDAPSDARGLIHKGVAYIVAANHLDRHGVARTLGHEAIGHYGLWKLLGADGTRQFERNVQLALKSGNVPLTKIAARVRSLYVDENGKFNLSPREEANEIAAFAVEEALDADGNFKPGYGFLKQVWAKIAAYLRDIGIDVDFTHAELHGMLVTAMKGLEAGHRLEGGSEVLVAAARDAENLPEQNALREISGNDEMFQYPVSYMDTVEGITAEIAPHIKVRKLTNIPGETRYVFETPDGNTQRMMVRPHNPYANEDAPTIYGYDLDENHEMTGTVTERPGKNPEYADGKDDVFVDVSLMRPGERGAAIYAIAANYAHNTGKVFIGDPSGLSDHAMKRRVEQMLSSALKFGTTDHLAPHPRQVKGDTSIGVPALNWTYGDDLGNIKSLIRVSNAIYGNDNPITFEPVTGRYLDSEGVELDDDAISLAVRAGRERAPGIGMATAKRNAVLSALVSKGDTGSDRTRGRDQLLEKLLDVGREFPAATSRIFYARGVTPGLFTPTIWETPAPTRTDKVIYELQDGRIDLKRVQEAIAKSGQQIEEKWDARLAETVYPGRVAYRSHEFLKSEVKPLLKSMAVHKATMAELADYLHARGAEERNKQVAKVNPSLPDGGAGKNSKGVLMTNQAARDYLDAISPTRKQVLDVLASKVDAITAGTRQLLVTEGLEKQETIDAWTDTYKNYVPMFRDEAQSGAPHPQGSGFSVKGSASKRATGSTKEVTNILAHVLMQREAAITRAEKNRVAVSLYGQALSHPNPEFWTTIKPSMTSASIATELQGMGIDPMTATVGMEMAPTIATVDPNTGKKVDRPNPMYKSLPGAIPLKVNGEDRVLMINTENERGARMAENLKNLDGLTKLDLANSIIGKATRWLASVNTQYNPAFGLTNLTRDTLGAAVNLGSTELRGNALKVLAKTPVAIVGIARELMSGNQSGKWQTLYRQFQADGGQTGWKENFRDTGDRAKAIETELAGIQRGMLSPGRAAHAILDVLDGFNTTLENAVRLSAYSAALDAGISRAEAARLGRELTVDFNRKGRMGREAGPLYAFFNASVQGTARTMEAVNGPTGAKIIAGGLAIGTIQVLMLLAAGYDDDEVPEFVKTRSLVIPTNWTGKGDKKHVLIPYPLGLHVIPNTGRVITELSMNGAKDIGARSFAAIGEIAGAFNPLGGGNIFTADGALKTAAPTLVDPLIEIGFNKNFAGNNIERPPYKGETDTRPGVARTKESTQRSTTGQVYMGISKAINAMTGGTDYEAGKLSPTPERLRYIAQTVGGGVLRELEKGINASTAASHGEKVKMSQIPVAGRFYGEVDADQVKTSRYFDTSAKLDKLETTKKTITKAADPDALEKLMKDHPEIALVNLGNKVQSAVAKLNKAAVMTIDDPEGLKAIDENRVQVMDVLNQAVAELESQTQKPTVAAKIKGWRKEAVTP